jgi:hypothetical protein
MLASLTSAVDEPLLLRIGGRMLTGGAMVMRLDLHDDRRGGIIVRMCQRCGGWLSSASSRSRALGTNPSRFDLLT